jgi:4-hydroxy-2-oxoheptanedioate aldolase
MKNLIEQLSYLNKTYNIVGVKQSFEDEGVVFDDVVTMRRITELCNLPLFVKIGGCEAKTDINNCIRLGIDAVIAPMVETPFSFSKYLNSVDSTSNIKLQFVCESITAYNNLEDILSLDTNSRLAGIVIGRSDFTKSLGLNKSQVDSKDICEYVESILITSKKHKLITTLGGNISTKSSNFIKDMFLKGYLDKIETRNVVIGLNSNNINNLDEVISNALDFEINWLKYKSKLYSEISNEYIYRSGLLESRK